MVKHGLLHLGQVPHRADVNQLRSAVLDLAARIARVQEMVGVEKVVEMRWNHYSNPPKRKSSKLWKRWGK